MSEASVRVLISASVVILDQMRRTILGALLASAFSFSRIGSAFCALIHPSRHRIAQTLLETFAARAASSTLFFSAIGARI